MKTLLAVLVAVSGLLLSVRADASTYALQEAQITVDVPDTWDTTPDTGNVTFTTKDQALAINVASAGAQDLDATWDLLVKQVNMVVTGLKVSKKAGVLSGMSGYVDSGKGSLNGTKVSCLLAVLPAPKGSITVFVIGVLGQYEKYDAEMNHVLDGILAAGASASAGGITYSEPVAADAQKFATKLVAAIDKNDAKTFLKLVAKKGFTIADNDASVLVKSAKLKKAIKKAGGVAAYLGIATSGAWQVQKNEGDASLSLYRGDLSGVVRYLSLAKVKGKWWVTGSYMEDHGVE